MLPTAQKLHTSPPVQEKFSLLIISPHKEDRTAVSKILQNPCWRIDQASTLEEAKHHLEYRSASVILCESDLADGCWRDLLPVLRELPTAASVVVISRQANDDLWSDVLSTGGYDVLSKPFDRRELVRVVGMAWRQSYTKSTAMRKPIEAHLAQAAAS
ncbi:MAG: response regulator [Bryobacteraceae bacterium]